MVNYMDSGCDLHPFQLHWIKMKTYTFFQGQFCLCASRQKCQTSVERTDFQPHRKSSVKMTCSSQTHNRKSWESCIFVKHWGIIIWILRHELNRGERGNISGAAAHVLTVIWKSAVWMRHQGLCWMPRARGQVLKPSAGAAQSAGNELKCKNAYKNANADKKKRGTL